ncbi:hypothetical protein NMY22_g19309 [Coprinellus aureogranulatus]|nr:hypothetical protein NMY22_g19309 [Coprinellus aureogranulatus]
MASTSYIDAPSFSHGPWKDAPRPYPFSTRCARFLGATKAATPPTNNSLALSVFQARAEATSRNTCIPPTLFASPTARCIFTPTRGGYRNTTPYLSVFCPDEEPDNKLGGVHTKLPLTGIAHHGAADDESELLFVGDSARVKSFSWAVGDKNAGQDSILAVHTMDSKGFTGAMGVLPNGRLGRSGKGNIAIWNVNDLPTHKEAEHGIIGKLVDLSYCTRQDVYDIEESSGVKPDNVIALESEDSLSIFRWEAILL